MPVSLDVCLHFWLLVVKVTTYFFYDFHENFYKNLSFMQTCLFFILLLFLICRFLFFSLSSCCLSYIHLFYNHLSLCLQLDLNFIFYLFYLYFVLPVLLVCLSGGLGRNQYRSWLDCSSYLFLG